MADGSQKDSSKEILGLMSKGDFIRVAVILIALVFIFEMVYMYSNGSGRGSDGTADNASAGFTGTAALTASLSSYSPYIVISKAPSTLNLSRVKAIPGVDDAIPNQGGLVVAVSDAGNATVPGIYAKLQAMNLSGYAQAVLTLPPLFNLTNSSGGSEEVTAHQITVQLEPVFENGESLDIEVTMEAQDKVVVAYYPQITLVPRLTNLTVNATVFSLAGSFTEVSIPWQNRTQVTAELVNSQFVEYANRTVFDNATNSTTVVQVPVRMNATYVRRDIMRGTPVNGTPPYAYKLTDNIFNAGNESDLNVVNADFTNTTFPASSVYVYAHAETGLDAFSRNYTYRYAVMVGGMQASQSLSALELPYLLSKGDTVEVMVQAYAIKDRIFSVESIAPLSSNGSS
jgi:hypothetical protein